MSGLEGVKPGDVVLLVEIYQRDAAPKPVTVAKVGRTLVHVAVDPQRLEYGYDTYRIADGTRNEKDPRTRLITRAQQEEREKRAELVGALHARGLRFRDGVGSFLREHDVDTLQGLLDALEGRTYAAGYRAGRAEAGGQE